MLLAKGVSTLIRLKALHYVDVESSKVGSALRKQVLEFILEHRPRVPNIYYCHAVSAISGRPERSKQFEFEWPAQFDENGLRRKG